MYEPLNDYKVLETKGGGVKWKSSITGGIVNNSIEDDVKKLLVNWKMSKRLTLFFLTEAKKEAPLVLSDKINSSLKK